MCPDKQVWEGLHLRLMPSRIFCGSDGWQPNDEAPLIQLFSVGTLKQTVFHHSQQIQPTSRYKHRSCSTVHVAAGPRACLSHCSTAEKSMHLKFQIERHLAMQWMHSTARQWQHHSCWTLTPKHESTAAWLPQEASCTSVWLCPSERSVPSRH